MKYVVTYQAHVATGNQLFRCEADNDDHARRQCELAHPDATIHKVERAPVETQD